MTGHMCLACQGVHEPKPWNTGQRDGENHYGILFTPELIGKIVVTLDGVDVTRRTLQCMAGEEGWVISYDYAPDGMPHFCVNHRGGGYRGCDHWATTIEYGKVEVSDKVHQ